MMHIYREPVQDKARRVDPGEGERPTMEEVACTLSRYSMGRAGVWGEPGGGSLLGGKARVWTGSRM